jgi:hypothetical protein
VRLHVDDPAALDAGLLLFAAFVVRTLADDASGDRSSASAVAATSSAGC